MQLRANRFFYTTSVLASLLMSQVNNVRSCVMWASNLRSILKMEEINIAIVKCSCRRQMQTRQIYVLKSGNQLKSVSKAPG